jgi:hypothetical protein
MVSPEPIDSSNVPACLCTLCSRRGRNWRHKTTVIPWGTKTSAAWNLARENQVQLHRLLHHQRDSAIFSSCSLTNAHWEGKNYILRGEDSSTE